MKDWREMAFWGLFLLMFSAGLVLPELSFALILDFVLGC